MQLRHEKPGLKRVGKIAYAMEVRVHGLEEGRLSREGCRGKVVVIPR
jgi:hypothetical protein